MLNICPLLNMDYLGRLIPRYKIRTKKKVFKATVDKMEELADDGLDYSGKMLYVSVRLHGGCKRGCPADRGEISKIERQSGN